MSKIKILHVVRPAAGGMKKHLLDLVRLTPKDRFEVSVACPAGSSIQEELIKLGVSVFPIPLAGELSPARDWATVRLLARHLVSEQITVMHAHSSKGALVGRLAAAMAHTPAAFFTAHNSIFYEEWPGWKINLFALAERFLARFTDRIITVSDALKKDILNKEKIPAKQLTTIYNGIDMDSFNSNVDTLAVRKSLGLPPLGQVVGTIARLAPQKGVTYFLRAASLLKDYQVNFIVVGDGPLREQLERETVELGLQDRVTFAGQRDNIPAVLPVFDIFVLPSVTEGLPLTILEAMATARPVVATTVGGIPEVIQEGKNGLLVAPRDPEALAVALAGLLAERERAARMGAAGKSLVQERFTVASMVEKTVNLYLSVLEEKGFDNYTGAQNRMVGL